MLKLSKNYLRIDEDYKEDDESIEFFIEVAKEYMKNATDKTFNQEIYLHKILVLMLVTDWYENRNISISNELSRTLSSIILQIGLM